MSLPINLQDALKKLYFFLTQDIAMTTGSPPREIMVKDALFAKKLAEADAFFSQWHQIKTAIVNIPDNGYGNKLRDTDQCVREAIDSFKHHITHPTLTLAVTGTTSSGKSSLINLLCGADIMPREVGEMSAGIVTISHIREEKNIRLTIHKTKNAKWQCGTWNKLTDKNIREQLTACMNSYNQHREDANPPEFPKIELDYPITCFLDKSLLGLHGLPETTQFKLLDLPGLKNTGDTLNKEVIKYCREALCLVTYNMAETDPIKRQALIQEVLIQVKAMGGSPNRMLFVMNRIDVYDQDHNAASRKDEAISKALTEIKAVLTRGLPEYKEQINQLNYSRLSSLPGLYAHWLQFAHPLNVFAANQLDNDFKRLTPEKEEFKKRDIRLDEPENWQQEDFDWVRSSIWKTSHADNFHNLLDSHIQTHFSMLVLPPLQEELKSKINGPVGDLLRHANAQLADSEQKCREALERLGKQNEQLKQLFSHSTQQLAIIVEEDDLEEACYTLLEQAPYKNLSPDALASLYDWDENIKRAMAGVIAGAVSYLQTDDFGATAAEHLPVLLKSRLCRECYKFKKSKYPLTGNKIGTFWNESDLDAFGVALWEFCQANSEILTSYVEQTILPQELGRIKEALNTLLIQHINYLQNQINQIVPDWGLTLSTKNLLATRELFAHNPSIKLDFSLTAEISKDTEEESNPWLLWLFKRDVEYATVPSIHTLVDVFGSQLDSERQRIHPLMVEDIKYLFTRLHDKIITEQQKVRSDFDAKYQQRLKDLEQGKRSAQAPWQLLMPVIKQWDDVAKSVTDSSTIR